MSSDGPLLSVVTVVRNDREGLLRTCESVRAQDDADFEHIVVDGASTDGSERLEETYRPESFVSEPDRGIYDAMSKGAALARGGFIAFLNAGDVFARADVLHDVEARLRHSACRWSYGRARVTDAAGVDVRRAVGAVPYSRWFHRYGLATVCHQAVWMRADEFRALGGFDETFGHAADYHLLVKAGTVTTPRTWPDVDVLYQAGGVSDADVYRQLFRRHRARVEALAMTRLRSESDLLWTYLQVAYVWSRKRTKHLLNATTAGRRLLLRAVGNPLPR